MQLFFRKTNQNSKTNKFKIKDIPTRENASISTYAKVGALKLSMEILLIFLLKFYLARTKERNIGEKQSKGSVMLLKFGAKIENAIAQNSLRP